VQRSDLKYILVPEHHADGEKIHFHCISNSAALKLEPARYPNGRFIRKMRGGESKVLYNVVDWKYGHSSCEVISGDNSRDKVAKYIFKYMGKQLGSGQKIGGRFFLHGGKMKLPHYAYADDPREFFTDEDKPAFVKSKQITSAVSFTEWAFI
jgi:hypothetical protein